MYVVLIFPQDGEVVLYAYNLADGKDEPLQKQIQKEATKITRWNNARYHLLNCVALQKMGLFNHGNIQNVPEEKHCSVSHVVYSDCHLDMFYNS